MNQGPRVILLDEIIMQETHKAELNLIPLLPERSKTEHTPPHLQSGALISTGQLFYDGCTSKLTVTGMTVKKQGALVLEGTHNGAAGIWQVKLTTPQPIPTTKINKQKPDMAQWYYATLFIPTKKTIIQAIKEYYFTTCLNLKVDLINKHLPP